MSANTPVLYGRSSSHFTRLVRIVAHEYAVALELRVIRDLMSLDPADYGDNPALKMPVLRDSGGTWFGALNICRRLAHISDRNLHMVWPEGLDDPITANAQELILHSMATEVALVMGRTEEGEDLPHRQKFRASLDGSLDWLEAHLDEALAALPPTRDLSFLEISAFCLVRHLVFREVLEEINRPVLEAFADAMGARPSARATEFAFDP